MRNFIHLILFAFLIGATSCSNQSGYPLYPIEIDNKMGYIDSTGHIVIEPKFDYAARFYDGLALVIIDSMYGYIDKKGEFRIPPKFSFLNYLKAKTFPTTHIEGKIHKPDSLAMYIKDRPDSIFNYGEFSELEFSGDKAAFTGIDYKFGFINKKGEVVIKPQLNRVRQFKEGVAAARLGYEWGFINHKGNFDIKPEYTDVLDFYEGKAVAKIVYDFTDKDGHIMYNNKVFVIDKSGKILLTADKDIWDISHFRNGYAMCYNVTYQYFHGERGTNFIDLNGGYLIDYEKGSFKAANYPVMKTDNYTMMFPVKVNNGKWGLLPKDYETNPLFNFETAFVYDDMGNFFEGLARVKVEDDLRGDKWGYIDTDNELVIKPQYSLAKRFRDGLAYVEQQTPGLKIVGYINKKGVMVWSRKIIGN